MSVEGFVFLSVSLSLLVGLVKLARGMEKPK